VPSMRSVNTSSVSVRSQVLGASNDTARLMLGMGPAIGKNMNTTKNPAPLALLNSRNLLGVIREALLDVRTTCDEDTARIALIVAACDRVEKRGIAQSNDVISLESALEAIS